jgi:hypothetical protein
LGNIPQAMEDKATIAFSMSWTRVSFDCPPMSFEATELLPSCLFLALSTSTCPESESAKGEAKER